MPDDGTTLYRIVYSQGAFHVVLRYGGTHASGPHEDENTAYRYAQALEKDCEDFFEQGNKLPEWAMGNHFVVTTTNISCAHCEKSLRPGTTAYHAKREDFCDLGCAQMTGF